MKAELLNLARRPQRLRKRKRKGHRSLFNDEERQAAVAAVLRVSRQSVSRRYNDWLNGDATAIQGASRAGRKRQLTKAQVEQIRVKLLQGASAQGSASDLWTLPRGAKLIEAVSSMHYHPGHVWRVLRQMDGVCNGRASGRRNEMRRQFAAGKEEPGPR